MMHYNHLRRAPARQIPRTEPIDAKTRADILRWLNEHDAREAAAMADAALKALIEGRDFDEARFKRERAVVVLEALEQYQREILNGAATRGMLYAP